MFRFAVVGSMWFALWHWRFRFI